MRKNKLRSRGRTELRKWLAEQGHGALSRLAKVTKIPKETVSRLANGQRPPTLKQAAAIQVVTGITADAWTFPPAAIKAA